MRINNNIFYSEGYKKLKLLSVFILTFSSLVSVIAQEKEDRDIIESKKLLSDAGLEMKNGNFPLAEADYRKAISLNPKDEIGKYNLGTAYYNKEMNANAMQRFLQAASVASNKTEKHKAFHNLGNTFMNDKKYKEAVETYKNALRNNPTDDETRYNLALAKKMLEEEQKKGGDDEDNKDKDNKENQNNKDKKDNKDNKEGDDGDEKEDKDKGNEKDDKKEGDEKEDKGNPERPKEKKKDQKQPVHGKLSTQQIKNLLEAMNNEEKKVQDKINAKKQKGAKVKSEKDW